MLMSSCGGNDSKIQFEVAPGSPRGPLVFQCDPASGVGCGQSLRALWLDAEGGRGWAVGSGGVVRRYGGAQLIRGQAASAASGGNGLNALWLDPEGKRGWAVGSGGVVLRYDGTQWKRDETASAASGGGDL